MRAVVHGFKIEPGRLPVVTLMPFGVWSEDTFDVPLDTETAKAILGQWPASDKVEITVTLIGET